MKIENAKGRRDENSGYTRLLGNARLGQLLSKVQATVISNGTELERIILSRTNNISDLDGFIDSVTDGTQPDGVYVCPKDVAKKSKLTLPKHEPDLLVYRVQQEECSCKVIELKDGDTFDTKKVRGEREQIEEYSHNLESKTHITTEYDICSFNQNNKKSIETGLKGEFTPDHIMTGREFCDILSIDYDDIVEARKADAQDNVDYFISELLNIPEIKTKILRKLKK